MKIIKIFIFSFIINIVFSNDFDLIEESFNENNISTFYLSSFDMTTGATDIELFRYRLRVLNNQLLENNDLELKLEFSMTVTSPMIGYNNASISGVPQLSTSSLGGSVGSYPDPPFLTITLDTPNSLLKSGSIKAPDPVTVLVIYYETITI